MFLSPIEILMSRPYYLLLLVEFMTSRFIVLVLSNPCRWKVGSFTASPSADTSCQFTRTCHLPHASQDKYCSSLPECKLVCSAMEVQHLSTVQIVFLTPWVKCSGKHFSSKCFPIFFEECIHRFVQRCLQRITLFMTGLFFNCPAFHYFIVGLMIFRRGSGFPLGELVRN